MSFPRYPKYKDSDVDWLGYVPDHWEVKPLRRLSCLVQTGPFGSQLHADEYVTGGTPVVNPVNMINGKIVPNEDVTVPDDVLDRLPHQRLCAGDVVFSRRGELGRCALVTQKEDGWLCGTGSMILRLYKTESDARYLSDFLSLDVLRQYFESFSIGAIMDSLSSTTLLSMPMLIPPIEEQAAVASFLDSETAKIDALMKEQRRLIELLIEKRQAVISHAVTKGLNPHVAMKPSGYEWFGDVPRHWTEGVKLRTLAKREPSSFTNGPFGSDLLTSELQEEGVPVIYIRDLKPGEYCRRSSSCVTLEKAAQLDKFRVDPHDILIAKVGDPPGFCCLYPEDEPVGIICQDVIRMKANLELICPDYICYLLNSGPGIEAVDSICVELTRKRFSLADLQSLRLPLPPRNEQDDIAKWLKHKVVEFDSLIGEAERATTLLRDRRTALISAAVTGKIDVRGFAETITT